MSICRSSVPTCRQAPAGPPGSIGLSLRMACGPAQAIRLTPSCEDSVSCPPPASSHLRRHSAGGPLALPLGGRDNPERFQSQPG